MNEKQTGDLDSAFEPAIIIFGRDESGKAHASAFGPADLSLAEKAAGLMEMSYLRVMGPDARALAMALPRGRIFSSGRAFAPFCKTTVFAALQGLDGEVPPPSEGGEPTGTDDQALAPPVHTSIAATRDGIIAGALVLAAETESNAGWFEAVVEEVKAEGLCVLRWHGWPGLPVFVRDIGDIGLLPPPRSGDAGTSPDGGEGSA